MELSEIIDRINIVEYISKFVDLEEKNGEYWGLSPFKDEKTPSFSVREESKSFYDFSSGIGGNVFTFTKFYFNCSATKAVDTLKNYLGMGSDGSLPPEQKMSATLVCKKYSKPKSRKKVLKKNELYPEDFMLRYEKDMEKLQVWKDEEISEKAMCDFQVYYDKLSDRIVYPIRNLDGNIVNIGGRTLDPQWKEKGLRKYTYFSGWGQLNIIYGLYENLDCIKSSEEIILFEGCKSVLKAYSWGIKNTGAILTSHLNPEQMKLLAKLGCRVVFALDKEVDIKKDHNISKLKNYVRIDVIADTEGLIGIKDSPVDGGCDVFKHLYDTRKRLN